MPRVSAAFFTVAVLCILVGGAFGLHMASGGSGSFTDLHVHLNLVGWATMALCGTFYALTQKTMWKWMAWINFWVLTAGIVLVFPAFYLYLIHNNDPKMEPFMIGGSMLTGLGMLIFFFAVIGELFRKRG